MTITARRRVADGIRSIRAIFIGDSITAGTGDAVPPGNFASLTASALGLTAAQWLQWAVSGYRVDLNILPGYNPTMNAEHRLLSVAYVWCGTNDGANGVTAATCWSNLSVILGSLRDAGYYVILIGCLPRSDVMNVSQGTFNAFRAAYNVLQAASVGTFCDAYLDPGATTLSDPLTFQDLVHPTGAQQATFATTSAAPAASGHV